MSYKGKSKVAFYEQKWFKLICFFALFGWIFYMTHSTFEINKNELMELNVTVAKEWESGGQRDPFKLYFTTKEYPSRFGIYVGGIFGRWSEVTDNLEPNRKIKIKIHKSNTYNLNKKTEVIPIYYLKNDTSDIIFNEDQFNAGEKSSDNRVNWFFLIIFLLGLWNILTE